MEKISRLVINKNVINIDTPNRNKVLNKKLNIKDLDILGRGSYGTVIKAIYKGEPVAVKIIENNNNIKYKSLKCEENIVGWDHENIIKVIKIARDPDYGIVIMERLNGHCLQHILDRRILPLYHRLKIILDVANALCFCHKNHILHLDIKPQNILIELIKNNNKNLIQYICKLCDFGCSLNIMTENCDDCQNDQRGTVRYMAPEIFKKNLITPSVDIYSLGITMWQISTNMYPYSDIESNDVVIYLVVKNNLRPNITYERNNNKINMSPKLSTPLYCDCLCTDIDNKLNSNNKIKPLTNKLLKPIIQIPTINITTILNDSTTEKLFNENDYSLKNKKMKNNFLVPSNMKSFDRKKTFMLEKNCLLLAKTEINVENLFKNSKKVYLSDGDCQNYSLNLNKNMIKNNSKQNKNNDNSSKKNIKKKLFQINNENYAEHGKYDYFYNIEKLFSNNVIISNQNLSNCEKDFTNLYKLCWHTDCTQRPTAENLAIILNELMKIF